MNDWRNEKKYFPTYQGKMAGKMIGTLHRNRLRSFPMAIKGSAQVPSGVGLSGSRSSRHFGTFNTRNCTWLVKKIGTRWVRRTLQSKADIFVVCWVRRGNVPRKRAFRLVERPMAMGRVKGRAYTDRLRGWWLAFNAGRLDYPTFAPRVPRTMRSNVNASAAITV